MNAANEENLTTSEQTIEILYRSTHRLLYGTVRAAFAVCSIESR